MKPGDIINTTPNKGRKNERERYIPTVPTRVQYKHSSVFILKCSPAWNPAVLMGLMGSGHSGALEGEVMGRCVCVFSCGCVGVRQSVQEHYGSAAPPPPHSNAPKET